MITNDHLDQMIAGPVTLIVNDKGQVIGNSQALARMLKGLALAINEFASGTNRETNLLLEKIEKLE